MTTMNVLVGVCIWVLGFYKPKALGALMSFLELCSLFVTKSLCFCLRLFDTIVELYAMDENDIFLGK